MQQQSGCNGNATTKEELIRELTGEGIQVKEHPLLASALLISGYDYLAAIPAFREGKFQVQDAASIMVAEQAGIKEGDYILDVCAAPGGKALHAAQILNGTGMVEARDLTEMKVELIRENISRMGFENIRAVQQDATCFDADSEEKADVLIADLPCSGLGVLAKKTDLKYKMNLETETEVAALAERDPGYGLSICEAGGNTDVQHLYDQQDRERGKRRMVCRKTSGI